MNGRYRKPGLLVAAALALTATPISAVARAGSNRPPAKIPTEVPVRPLLFEPTAAGDAFVSRGGDYTLELGAGGIRLAAAGTPVMRLYFPGGRRVKPRPEGVAVAESHYYAGNDRSKWRIGVPNYEKVRYPGIYPGVDVVFYGAGNEFEYDFALAPFADPGQVKMRVEDARQAALDDAGNLVLGSFKLRRPRARQDGREVEASFRVGDDGAVSFDLGDYDHSRPLLIDPVITYSTYLGGTFADRAAEVAVDREGNVYVAGETFSPGFPGALAFGQRPLPSHQFGFVTKYAPFSGGRSRLLFTILLGDNADPTGGGVLLSSVAVDSAGNILLAGTTGSLNFPLQNPVQAQVSGSPECENQDGTTTVRCPDGFVAKFAPDGRSLLFSTYFGGRLPTELRRVVADSTGDIYALGRQVGRTNLAGTDNAYQREQTTATFDLLLVRFSAAGQLLYATYLGGNGQELPRSLAVERPGVVWLAAETTSTDIPTSPGALQTAFPSLRRAGYIARLDTTVAGRAGLTYATYFGPVRANSTIAKVFADGSGQAVFCGSTSGQIPVTPTGMLRVFLAAPQSRVSDATFADGDGFVARINPALTGGAQLTYGSYVGGRDIDTAESCAQDANGNLLVTGTTSSLEPFLVPGSPFPFKLATAATPPVSNLYLIRINPSMANGLVDSLLFGGINVDAVRALAVDAARRYAYLTGVTFSRMFPTTPFVEQAIYGGDTRELPGAQVNLGAGVGDAFLMQVDLTAPHVAAMALGAHAGNFAFAAPGGTVTLTARLEDGNGNPVALPGYPLLFDGTNVTIANPNAVTDAEGRASVTARLTAAGEATVRALSIDPIRAFTFRLRAIAGTLPASVAVVSGGAQSGRPGTALPAPLVVELRDAAGAPLALADVTVQFRTSNAAVSASTAATNAQGRAQTMVTLGSQPGPATVTVVVGNLPEVVVTLPPAARRSPPRVSPTAPPSDPARCRRG